jgi:hypothetical protein
LRRVARSGGRFTTEARRTRRGEGRVCRFGGWVRSAVLVRGWRTEYFGTFGKVAAGVCQVGTWLRFAVLGLVASGCIRLLLHLGALGCTVWVRFAQKVIVARVGVVWRSLARGGTGGSWNRRFETSNCGGAPAQQLSGTRPSPLPSPTAVRRAREGTQLAALGEGVACCARMVSPYKGAVVRACDEEFGRIAVLGRILRFFWGWTPLRFARRGRAPGGGYLLGWRGVGVVSINAGRWPHSGQRFGVARRS